jgi:hypothetical protein
MSRTQFEEKKLTLEKKIINIYAHTINSTEILGFCYKVGLGSDGGDEYLIVDSPENQRQRSLKVELKEREREREREAWVHKDFVFFFFED